MMTGMPRGQWGKLIPQSSAGIKRTKARNKKEGRTMKPTSGGDGKRKQETCRKGDSKQAEANVEEDTNERQNSCVRL